ncbi:hypothetical protein FOZ61_007778 [Perkinsus olseni]|uniref:Peptidase A1 domain-containing protein n=1 Tax=Perkinsus olseni TaxID=32597 RepID=A0A7J6L7D0_PEROL|nr:hypothetical protein FOZ61_007778 [Perkinsus olseni]KAF4658140.1 hypothetical protein FOL46_007080 [Perkinsus olseni]
MSFHIRPTRPFGPPGQVEELISSVIERARSKEGEGVVKWSTSGYYWLKCDDAKYLPDLHLDFTVEGSGTASRLTISGRYLTRELPEAGNDSPCKLALKPRDRDYWVLGVPLFRGRDIDFDFRTGKLGVTLSREKTRDKELWAFERVLQPGLEAIFVRCNSTFSALDSKLVACGTL